MDDNIAACVFEAQEPPAAVKEDNHEAPATIIVDDSPVLRGVLDPDDEVFAREFWETKPSLQRTFLTVESWIKHLESQMDPGCRRW